VTVVVLVVVVPGGGSDNASAEGDTSRIDEEFGDVRFIFVSLFAFFFLPGLTGAGWLKSVGMRFS